MHAQTSRSSTRGTTMSHRPINPRAQKEGKRRFFAHYRKQTNSPRPPRSPPYHRVHDHRSLRASPILHEPLPPTMPVPIFAALRRRLLEKGFEGYIRVAEAPSHPDALDIAKKLNVDTVTNATIWKNWTYLRMGRNTSTSPYRIFRRIFWGIFCISQGIQNERHPEPILSGNSQVPT